MARFDRDGVSFDFPDGWRGLSVTSVNKPVAWDKPDVCNILVSQEPLAEGETIDTRARNKLMTLARELPKFQYLETIDSQVAGRRARVVTFRYGGDEERLEQRVVTMECATPSGRAAVVLSAVYSLVNQEKYARALAAIIQSFRFE
jgi:hypothetical protein